MKPLKLEIENLRSFRAKREIDFRNLGLFAIIGDTGAGKTSILEAITYALYYRSTWNGRNVKELIANGALAMSVTFTFEVDGAEYTVTRITRTRGTPSHRLTCLARSVDVSGEDPVRDRIYEALHLNDDTFLHTVLLPQGRHAELLTANESVRNRMLGEIFRLDDIGRVAELAKGQTAQTEAVLTARRRDRAADAADLEAALAEAQAKVDAARKDLQAAEAAATRVKSLDDQIAQHAKTISTLEQRISNVADAPGLVAKLHALDSVARDLDAQADEAKTLLASALAAHDVARNELQSLGDRGLDRDTLNGHKVQLESCAGEIRERARELNAVQNALATVPAKKATLEGKQRTKARSERALSNARRAVADAEARAAIERPKVAHLESAIGSLTRAQAAVTAENSVLEQRSGKVKSLRTALDEATHALREGQSAADEAKRQLEEATVAAGAAAIATHLHAGDHCPVCRRELPASFVPPKDADLAAAKARDTAARNAITKANVNVTTLQTQLESTQALVDETRAKLATATADLKQAVAGVPPEATAEPERALAGMKAELVETEEAILELRGAQDVATTASTEAAKAEAAATSDLAGIEKEIERLRASIGGRDQACVTKIAQLPEMFRPATQDEDGLVAARAHVEDALKVAADATAAEAAASKRVAEAHNKIARIDLERLERVSGPRMKVTGLLERIAAFLALQPLPEDETKYRAWVDTVEAAAKRGTEAAQEAASLAARAKTEAEEARSAEVNALGAEPSIATTNAALAKNNAERSVEVVRYRLEQRNDLDAKIARIEPVYMGLKVLKEELGARRFQTYATQLRQQRLLEVGSLILGDMSDRRYGFTRDFQIFDTFTNEARVAQTLSGGEKFLASLALSLAVVEIAANAGAKIGSLFLDEGFASLDSETLQMAMLELRRRAKQGRSICVISHLSEVAQFVEATFRVETSADGSQVTPVHGALDEDSAAMEGLVSQLTTAG